MAAAAAIWVVVVSSVAPTAAAVAAAVAVATVAAAAAAAAVATVAAVAAVVRATARPRPWRGGSLPGARRADGCKEVVTRIKLGTPRDRR